MPNPTSMTSVRRARLFELIRQEAMACKPRTQRAAVPLAARDAVRLQDIAVRSFETPRSAA